MNKNITARQVEIDNVNLTYSLKARGGFDFTVSVDGETFTLNREQTANVLDYALERLVQDRTCTLQAGEVSPGVMSTFARMAQGFWFQWSDKPRRSTNRKGK